MRRLLLGFHPPDFSEEEAWLPPWLQPSSSTTPLDSPSPQPFYFQETTTPGQNDDNDSTCKSLHLFLSGDDNLPLSSSNHEVQCHLHLSSIEESQYSLNPTLSTSQADKSEYTQALLLQHHEGNEACMVPSQQKGDLGITGPKSLSFKEDARCREADISDAIELAVAASEALTIHNVLKDEHLIASSVLEAAIRVKQARLENLSNSIGEDNEVDFDSLSDVDDLTMADAYEDVGLTVATHGDLIGHGSISHVNDSFASENYISNAKHKGNERGGPQADSGSISLKQHKQGNNANIFSKGSVLESCECVTRKEHVDYESFGTENANLACDVDPVFNCSVEQTDFCATEVGLQREGFSIGDLTSSSTIKMSNERPDKMTNLVPDRFQSRWFGGWTWKNEVSIPAVMDNQYKRTIPELFANETSYLSESADIAPDMCSYMQTQDKDKTVSQPSVAPQHAYEKANNNGNLLSDDVAVSLNVSPVDPLCSVVPCSFTSDSVVSQNSKHQVNLEKHMGPTVQPNLDDLENGQSLHTVRRQVSSLRTYSMLYPRCDPYLDREHTRGESSSSLRTYSMLYPKCDPYLDREHTRGESSSFEHNQTAKVYTALTNQREKDSELSSFAHNQTAKVDTALTNLREKDSESSLEHYQTTEVDIALTSQMEKDGEPSSFEHNQTVKVDTALTSQREKDGELSSFEHNKTAKVYTALPSQREEETTNVSRKVESIVPKRKRVRFSDTEICYPQVKKFQKSPQTRLKDPSVAARICRRLTRNKARPRNKDNKTLFEDLKFLITGFSVKKHKQIKTLVQKNGGTVLDDIPSPSTSRRKRCSKLPLILCPKKLLTTKFLYGCAVNAGILKITWLFDSVDEGLILPHQKYKILNDRSSNNRPIFDDIAIMLHGKQDFCSKMGKVIKHGGGSVFKTFHWLVKSLDSKKVSTGIIVVEDENGISRQLKQCALEQKVPVMPFNWIINSLYAGRLLPSPLFKLPDHMELSEEI